MPELELQETVAQEATTRYSIDDSPIGHPDIGGWSLYQIDQPVTKSEFWIVDTEGREASVKGWFENEDPFTQANLLNIEDNQVQELILQIRRSLFISHHESLANRLLTLFNAAKEEDPTNPGITVNSLRNFYYFFLLNDDIKCPTISLTPENNIYASWEDEQNRLFSVHFLPNDDVHFVIFKPNYRHPGQQIRLSGKATVDSLMETVVPNGVNDWITE